MVFGGYTGLLFSTLVLLILEINYWVTKAIANLNSGDLLSTV
ncbi:MAG TPA: hypothetical protein PLY70_08265 [Saprospiraceae bacterium]|nr:hypothetical protein [Saprospiraceae bacterium]